MSPHLDEKTAALSADKGKYFYAIKTSKFSEKSWKAFCFVAARGCVIMS